MSAALCSLIAVSANPSEADRDDENALGESNLPPKFPGIVSVGEGEVPAAAEMTAAAPRRNAAATWHQGDMLCVVLQEGRRNGLVVSLFRRFRESEDTKHRSNRML